MHEFSFASNIVDVIMQHVKKNNVKRVRSVIIEVGEFTMIIPEFLQNSYDIIKPSYPELEDSRIVVMNVPGKIRCDDCGVITEVSFKKPLNDGIDASISMMNPGAFSCSSCKGSRTTIVAGRQALVKSMNVDD